MPEELTLRVHGAAGLPVLIYLPGLHGDWTLIGGLRKALEGQVRFVEVTYPRTLTWTLEDYAEATEVALRTQGMEPGWLLGESFGSQLVWPILARRHFRVRGVILAGGFGRHPTPKTARVLSRVTARTPASMMRLSLFCYERLMRLRYRRSPEVLQHIGEFVARRTESDRQAVAHRLHLLARNDPSRLASFASPPVYALTGFWDPIVPWFWARKWLRRHCPNLKAYKIVCRADHTVLATAPQVSAGLIVKWMTAGTELKRAAKVTAHGSGLSQPRSIQMKFQPAGTRIKDRAWRG